MSNPVSHRSVPSVAAILARHREQTSAGRHQVPRKSSAACVEDVDTVAAHEAVAGGTVNGAVVVVDRAVGCVVEDIDTVAAYEAVADRTESARHHSTNNTMSSTTADNIYNVRGHLFLNTTPRSTQGEGRPAPAEATKPSSPHAAYGQWLPTFSIRWLVLALVMYFGAGFVVSAIKHEVSHSLNTMITPVTTPFHKLRQGATAWADGAWLSWLRGLPGNQEPSSPSRDGGPGEHDREGSPGFLGPIADAKKDTKGTAYNPWRPFSHFRLQPCSVTTQGAVPLGDALQEGIRGIHHAQEDLHALAAMDEAWRGVLQPLSKFSTKLQRATEAAADISSRYREFERDMQALTRREGRLRRRLLREIDTTPARLIGSRPHEGWRQVLAYYFGCLKRTGFPWARRDISERARLLRLRVKNWQDLLAHSAHRRKEIRIRLMSVNGKDGGSGTADNNMYGALCTPHKDVENALKKATLTSDSRGDAKHHKVPAKKSGDEERSGSASYGNLITARVITGLEDLEVGSHALCLIGEVLDDWGRERDGWLAAEVNLLSDMSSRVKEDLLPLLSDENGSALDEVDNATADKVEELLGTAISEWIAWQDEVYSGQQ